MFSLVKKDCRTFKPAKKRTYKRIENANKAAMLPID